MLFSHKLKALRISNNYSMDKLAELYNNKFGGKLNKSTISRYENGLQEPMFTVVMNFAKLFDVSVDYLIGTSEMPTSSTEQYTLSQKEIEHINTYRKLNTIGKAKADEYISDLSEQTKYTAGSGNIAEDIAQELSQELHTAPHTTSTK